MDNKDYRMMMQTVELTIKLPAESNLPNLMTKMTANENEKILKIGYDCFKMMETIEMKIKNDEIYERVKNESEIEKNKIKNEMKREIERQEIMNQIMKEMYDKEKNMMKTQIMELETKIIELRKNNEPEIDRIRGEIEDNIKRENEENKKRMENEKMRMEFEINNLRENILMKEEVIKKVTEFHEYMRKQNETKTSIQLGSEGEKLFENYANLAFRDYNGFKIENKSQQARKGDFHLYFDEFNVLVDSKNYETAVGKKEITKIERDLLENKTTKFAWLISLKTDVNSWNKCPIMYKWVLSEDGPKCIIIINNLCENKNPVDALRNICEITKELDKLTKKNDNLEENAEDLKELKYKLSLKVKSALEKISDLKRMITSISQTVKDMETDLIESLSMLTDELTKNDKEKENYMKEWWDNNICIDEENPDVKITSSTLWIKFRQTNKEFINEYEITSEIFKNFIKTIIPYEKYTERNKYGGSIELTGYMIKQQNVIQATTTITTTTMNDDREEEKEDNEDNKIIDYYKNTQIGVMEIASNFHMETYRVVSLLVKNKVIKKRNDARGYNEYKESAEYKSKISK
jgi:hypothetical protein